MLSQSIKGTAAFHVLAAVLLLFFKGAELHVDAWCNLRATPLPACAPSAEDISTFAASVKGDVTVVGTGGFCSFLENDFTPNAYASASDIKFYCYSNLVCAPDLPFPAHNSTNEQWAQWLQRSNAAAPPYCNVSLNVNYYNTDEDLFPAYIFTPVDENDVVAAVKFAVKHNLQISIISTGHDQYGGRNTGRDAFQIDFQHYNKITVDKIIPSVTVQPGALFSEIFAAAMNNGFVVARGWDTSVGSVGWSLNGGHGPFAPFLGLGLDNVLNVRIVVANGTAVNASATSNTDLYWSLLGSGGGNLGVVTSLTIRGHPLPSSVDSLKAIFTVDRVGMTSVLTTVHTLIAKNYQMWSFLYIVGAVHGDDSKRTLEMIALRWEHRGDSLSDVVDKFDKLSLNWQHDTVSNSSLIDWETWIQPSHEVPTPQRYPIAGTMVNITMVKDSLFVDLLVSGMFDYHNPLTILHPLAGPNKFDSQPYPPTGISDAFRNGVHYLAFLAPSGVPLPREELTPYTKFATQLRYGGVYPNEACARTYTEGSLEREYWDVDWKEDFWGPVDSVYARHLQVKKSWDPGFVFSCQHCVGSDLIPPM